jgi:uncharacterized protein YceK
MVGVIVGLMLTAALLTSGCGTLLTLLVPHAKFA